jgi:hypothetical protein
VSGSDKTVGDIERVAIRIKDASIKAVRAATVDAANSAKATTLFSDQTGDTRASIQAVFQLAGSNPFGVVQAGGASVFLENGTVFMEARPFMTEAREFGERSLQYYADLYVNEAVK